MRRDRQTGRELAATKGKQTRKGKNICCNVVLEASKRIFELQRKSNSCLILLNLNAPVFRFRLALSLAITNWLLVLLPFCLFVCLLRVRGVRSYAFNRRALSLTCCKPIGCPWNKKKLIIVICFFFLRSVKLRISVRLSASCGVLCHASVIVLCFYFFKNVFCTLT